jgi:uncharacterized protein (TIGR03435 family)
MESVMAKRVVFVLFALGWLASGQPAKPNPTAPAQAPATFEVAAIRPSDPATMGDCYMKGQPGGQTFTGRCIPLRVIMKYAYKITDSQIAAGPAWMDSELYDFEAKADRPITRAEVATLFQGLLADRFKLQFHKEARTMAAMALSVDKSGSKMTVNDSTYEWEIPVTNIPGKIPKFKGTRCPMSYLSWWIGQRENRPVLDKTGLGGFWDFTLEFVPDAMAVARKGANGDIPPMDGPSLVSALRDQLGLKLESEKAPVDVYIIDHVERATAN